MELGELIEALRHPAAYPIPVGEVAVRQTHISVVFLAGPFAYKIKKPVAFGFLDFSTLDQRRHFCHEEVRLNRRLAPDVYLGVAPIARSAGQVRIDGPGDVVEWAVQMRRLPDEATLEARLRQGTVTPGLIKDLARRLAAFHGTAERSGYISGFGRFEQVARNIRDLFPQSEAQVGATVSRAVFTRLRELTEAALAHARPLIDLRARHSVACDCHGDLHLDHVYYFPDQTPPHDLAIVDCIEFNERFRFIDPVADMAFPVMDLRFHGRRDLAQTFADAYFAATGDTEGRALLPLYAAYRAIVRGSVEGLKLAEREVGAAERDAELQHARAHWLLALGTLETPERRPCLVLVGGLPGTGKSSLARRLAEQANATVIRSDVVRKEQAGLEPDTPTPAALLTELYRPETTERTYAECLRRAEVEWFQGRRVIVDATFHEEPRRRQFLEAAGAWNIPAGILLCQADESIIRQRLAQRHGDASDADWRVHELLRQRWDTPGAAAESFLCRIDTGGSQEAALEQAWAALRSWELFPAG